MYDDEWDDFTGTGFLRKRITPEKVWTARLNPYLLRMAVPFLIQCPIKMSMKLFLPTNRVDFCELQMNLVVFLSVFTLMSILLGGVWLAGKTRLTFGKTEGKAQSLLSIFSSDNLSKQSHFLKYSPLLLVLFLPSLAMAAEATEVTSPGQPLDLTQHWAGYLALIVFASPTSLP